MKPGGQRQKGHSFERWVARELRTIWPEAKRGFQSRGGTKEAPDVEGCGPFVIECKHEAAPKPVAALRQAGEAVKDWIEQIPVAVTKRNRGEPQVTLWNHDLERLVDAASGVTVPVTISWADFKSICVQVFRSYGEDEQ